MSDETIAGLHSRLKEYYNQLSLAEEQTTCTIRFGKSSAVIHLSNSAIAERMTRSLRHLITDDHSTPCLTLFCFDGELASLHFSFPWSPTDFGIQGVIEGFNSKRFQSIYQHGSGAIILYDQERKEGIYYIQSSEQIPYWEASFPFRIIFHWWTRDTPYQLFHAGGIGGDNHSMIISGKSGSGKSSTCLSTLLHSDLKITGDDYVMVDTDDASLYSLYNCAKVEWDNLSRLSFLNSLVTNDREKDEKAMIFIDEWVKEKMLISSLLRFAIVPEIRGGSRTSFVESDSVIAFKSIAPTTLFQLPLMREEGFAKCVKLSKKLMTYKMLLGTDPTEIADSMANFLLKTV